MAIRCSLESVAGRAKQTGKFRPDKWNRGRPCAFCLGMKPSTQHAAKLFLWAVSCLWPLSAATEDLLNPSEFNFTVISAEVAKGPSLCVSPEGELGMSIAPPGAKLVKVMLKGQVTRAGRVILITPAFAGIYERAGQAQKKCRPGECTVC